MKGKLFTLLVLMLFYFFQAFPQAFEEVTATGLPGLSQGNLEWGDFDQDGDFDVLCVGYSNSSSPLSAVYRNNGNGTFSLFSGASLTDLYYGSCAWGDYNNDNYLDILITGMDAGGTPYTQIYRNNSGASFTLQTGISLRSLEYSSVDWGDYDNDGHIDILLSGQDNGGIRYTLVYRNNGNNTFTEQTGINLRQVSRGSTSWIDINYDGHLDIFITGYDQASTTICALYKNEGDGSFTEITGLPFVGVYYSDASWGDYDRDGDPDLLLTGYSTQLSTYITRLYKTGYDFTFADQGITNLTDMYISSGDWGDYDNDGDMDIILSGYSASGGITEVLRNDGDNTFVKNTGTNFPNIYYSSTQWGDFDGDRDLDILIGGYSGSGRITQVYRNTSTVPNTTPTTPTGLGIIQNSEGVHFSWNTADDNETTRWHLTYNLRIGTSPGASDIKSAASDLDSGELFLAEPGNTGRNYHYTMPALPPGTIYWSVQSVDHGYLGSPFSEEQVFENLFSLASVSYGGNGIPFLGDYDGDGDLDILDGNGAGTTVYRNELSDGGGFVDIGLPPGQYYGSDAQYAWFDYDNDGDLDFVFSGLDSTVIFRNDNGVFGNIEAGMQGVWMGDLDVGDYDNDGDQDLFLYGNHEHSDDGEPIGILYRNEGNDVFTDSELDIEEARRGSVSLGDYNNDGYIDILTCGYNLSENIFTSILRNNSGLSFTNIDAGVVGGSYGGLAWADYDNDGDLDFYFAGGDYGGSAETKVFQNHGDETFSDIGANLPVGSWSYDATVYWGDFDNDGDLDILPNYGTSIFRNDGNNTFSLQELGIDIETSTWGDLDNDGDLDIVTNDAIYFNHTQTGNNAPAIPQNIQVEIAGNQATLSWDSSSDDHTPSSGLTYNVRVGSSPGACDILGPMTDAAGLNKAIPSMGNAMTNTFKIIRELPLGTYYWSVQAVDQSYLSSPFSVEGSFEIFPMFTKVLDDYFNEDRISWADYDNDGDLDILLDEYNGIYIHQNIGNNIFQASLVNASEDYSQISWCDYDSDGDLDIISSDAVFRNDMNGNFTNTGISHNVPVSDSRQGDFDADGDIDFLTGATIYRNEGGFTFTEIELGFASGYYKHCIWIDYDNDSDLDIVYFHGGYEDWLVSLYRYDGDNTFTEIANDFIGVWMDYGHSSVADFNGDGLQDIYIGGSDNDNNKQSLLYRNNGDDSFTLMDANIRGYGDQKVFWGDYNYDGQMDLVISGWNNGRIRNLLYQNNQDGTFTELGIDNLVPRLGVFHSGDYDGDGDLDKITEEGVFRNNTNQHYPVPGAISGLSHDLKGLDCLLSWDRSVDPFGKGYSYNIKIGTSPGTSDIKAPNLLPGFGNVPSDTTFLIRGLEPGTYYWSVQAVSQVYAKGPWAANQSFVMTRVSPEFTYDTVCHHELTTFTDLSVTTDVIERWHWDFDDGSTSSSQNPSHVFPDAGAYNVMLRAFTQSGDSADRIHTVIVKSSPEASFSVEAVCKDRPSLLENHSLLNGVTVASWEWDFGNGEISNVQGTVEKTYVNSTTATLTIVADNGCQDADTHEVVVAPYPDATLSLLPGYSNIFCQGDSTLMVVPNHAGYNYQWKLNDANIFGATDTFLYVKSPSGEYKVEVENPLATCISKDSMQVTVNPAPTSPVISFSTDPGALCKGEPLTLSTPDIQNYTYDWRRDGGSLGVNEDEVNPVESGDYTVFVSNLYNCSALSNAVIVNFQDNPDQPTIIVGNTDICEGESVLMRVTDIAGLSYAWYRDDQLQQEGALYSYSATEEGIYTIEVINSDNCTSQGTESVDVTVRDLPVLPAISVEGNTTLCEGEELRLSVPYATGYEYLWKRDGGGTGIDTTLIYPTESGSYNVTITNAGFCPVEPESPVAIEFMARPAVPPISYPEDTVLCDGESLVLRTSEVAGLHYQWYNSEELLLGEESSSLTVSENGNYRVIVSNDIQCQTESDKIVNITVHSLPAVSSIEVDGNTEFCGTDSVKLSVTEWTGHSYEWRKGEVLLAYDAHEIYVSDNGTYTAKLVNEFGCKMSASNPVDVLALPYPAKPAVQGTNETAFCTGEVLQLTFDNLGTGEACIWSRNDVVFADSVEQIYVNESGDYFLEIINEIGCKSPPSSIKSLSFYDSPATPLLSIGTDTIVEVCPDELSNISVTNADAAYTYYWYHNTVGMTPDDNTTLAGVLEAGTYQVMADIEGCESPLVKFELAWKESPDKPRVVAEGGPVVYYLISDIQDADTYQWYYNGDVIAGANQYYYVANQNLGAYQLEISEDDKECSIRSDVVNVPDVSTGLDIPAEGSLMLYPNPSTGEFVLELKNNDYGEAWLKIVSMTGKILVLKELNKYAERLRESINIELLPGIYILQLETGERSYFERIIIE